MQTLISIMLYLALTFGQPKGVQPHNQISPPPCPGSPGCNQGGGGGSGGGLGGGGGGAF